MYPEQKLWTPYVPDRPLDLSYTTGSQTISSSSEPPSPSMSPTEASSVGSRVSPSVSPRVYPSVSPGVYPNISPGVSPSVSPGVYPSVSPGLSPSISPSVSPRMAPCVAPCVPHQPFAPPRGRNQRNATSRRASPQLPPSLRVLPLQMSYADYEREALSLLALSNGGSLVTNNPQMRRAVQTKRNADPNYLLQRQKNNAAAKKSRDLRKIRENKHTIRIQFLEGLLERMRKHMCPGCKSAIPFERVPEV